MIDPQVSIAFALHSNRGAYAALIGSGLSVGAGIPTGGQVVLDLISKVARVLGEDLGTTCPTGIRNASGRNLTTDSRFPKAARGVVSTNRMLRSSKEGRNAEIRDHASRRRSTAKPTGRRAEILNEYRGYIEQIGRTEAGKLTPGEGETTQAVSRRLGAAAKLAGEELEIRRTGDGIYFWHRARRPGRPRKRQD